MFGATGCPKMARMARATYASNCDFRKMLDDFSLKKSMQLKKKRFYPCFFTSTNHFHRRCFLAVMNPSSS